jgi:hypothetical protein
MAGRVTACKLANAAVKIAAVLHKATVSATMRARVPCAYQGRTGAWQRRSPECVRVGGVRTKSRSSNCDHWVRNIGRFARTMESHRNSRRCYRRKRPHVSKGFTSAQRACGRRGRMVVGWSGSSTYQIEVPQQIEEEHESPDEEHVVASCTAEVSMMTRTMTAASRRISKNMMARPQPLPRVG